MCASKNKDVRFAEIRNSKAFHDYFVEERLEAGLVLSGTEVKSIRGSKAQINDAFVKIIKGVPQLFQAHISEYTFGNLNNHLPARPRVLLLHTKEIERLRFATQAGGYTIIPLRLYFKKGLVKIEIALAKGKKQQDKREDLKSKAIQRDLERDFKQR